MSTSQPELLFKKILHLREPLVGLFFISLLTEQGELKETTLYIILEMSTEQQTMALQSVQLVAPLASPPSLAFSQSSNQVLSIKHHDVKGKVIYRQRGKVHYLDIIETVRKRNYVSGVSKKASGAETFLLDLQSMTQNKQSISVEKQNIFRISLKIPHDQFKCRGNMYMQGFQRRLHELELFCLTCTKKQNNTK